MSTESLPPAIGVTLATPDCDALHDIVADNFSGNLSAFEAASMLDRPLDQYVVLVFDANNTYVRGIYGTGTVGLRAAGDTRPDSERPRQDGGERVCGHPVRLDGQLVMGGRGGGPDRARSDAAATDDSTRSSGGFAVDSPLLIGRVAGVTVTRVNAGAGSGAGASSEAVVCDWNGGSSTCTRATPCCAPWRVAPYTFKSLPLVPGYGGRVSRNFVDDHSPSSYVVGLEEMRYRAEPPAGTLDLTQPNQAAGLTSPIRDSSGVAGIAAASVASVERIRFAMGQLSKGSVWVFVVNLTPSAPRQ